MLDHHRDLVAPTQLLKDISGRIIVGANGSDASLHAIDVVARLLPQSAILLVTAARMTHAMAYPTRSYDDLHGDSYLLSDESSVWEVQRRSREQAVRAGASTVSSARVDAGALRGLSHMVTETGATNVVLGARSGPTRLGKHLARTVPTHIVGLTASELVPVEPLSWRGRWTLRNRNQDAPWLAVPSTGDGLGAALG